LKPLPSTAPDQSADQRQRQLEEAADWSGAVDGSGFNQRTRDRLQRGEEQRPGDVPGGLCLGMEADKLQLPVFLRRAAVDPV
jgi:hypothetical protein